MVSATTLLRSPVVSLLSANPASSRAAQELLRDLFSIEPIALNNERDDELDQLLKIPLFGRSFDSVASKCPLSGTVLHFLSFTSPGASVSTNVNQHFGKLSLLAIADSSYNTQNDAFAAQESRRLVASHIGKDKNHYLHSLFLVMKHAAGRPITASAVTRLDGGLPLLSLPTRNDEESLQSLQSQQNSECGLKEIAIPIYDDALYSDGQSLFSVLGSSSLKRPAVGCYQWKDGGVVIRPLPSAKEDRTLPAPSLVFYCQHLEEAQSKVSNLGGTFAKIGHNGLKNSGQLMMSHPLLLGLDIRLTDTMQYASAFPEAQEALLASSLSELQNVNVCLEGGKGNDTVETKTDEGINKGDCWVEFRANIKRPSGFMQRVPRTGKVLTAKVPDLPYE